LGEGRGGVVKVNQNTINTNQKEFQNIKFQISKLNGIFKIYFDMNNKVLFFFLNQEQA